MKKLLIGIILALAIGASVLLYWKDLVSLVSASTDARVHTPAAALDGGKVGSELGASK